MKATFKDGRSSILVPGEEITSTSESYAGGWVRIAALGASSYFDTLKDSGIEGGEAVKVGDIIRLKAFGDGVTNPLSTGDKVVALEAKVTCWTTDCNNGFTEGTIDLTTQCDIINNRRDIVGDGNVQDTGTINGLFDTNSELQREMEGMFTRRIISKNGKITAIDKKKDQEIIHLFCYKEQKDAGDVQVYRIRRMRVSGLSEGQPSNGATPFNYNYETLESWNYEETVAA